MFVNRAKTQNTQTHSLIAEWPDNQRLVDQDVYSEGKTVHTKPGVTGDALRRGFERASRPAGMPIPLIGGAALVGTGGAAAGAAIYRWWTGNPNATVNELDIALNQFQIDFQLNRTDDWEIVDQQFRQFESDPKYKDPVCRKSLMRARSLLTLRKRDLEAREAQKQLSASQSNNLTETIATIQSLLGCMKNLGAMDRVAPQMATQAYQQNLSQQPEIKELKLDLSEIKTALKALLPEREAKRQEKVEKLEKAGLEELEKQLEEQDAAKSPARANDIPPSEGASATKVRTSREAAERDARNITQSQGANENDFKISDAAQQMAVSMRMQFMERVNAGKPQDSTNSKILGVLANDVLESHNVPSTLQLRRCLVNTVTEKARKAPRSDDAVLRSLAIVLTTIAPKQPAV